ncbi:shikimate dehydrogenase family protein [Roseibium aggregatum]|uniref:Shikimate dehydrogenase n=1 Tax=Roseibium aggregatum TaxID=187304 RepID=A0A926NX75_9HYPH|nr:shikimate dehydrogenase [Roseibium aggregatum]MBD1546974.1 shikimate dehydrogenase [Roseibium aggregatum]
MPITGATRLFPIIGHPVSGVFSPPAFNALFQKKNIDAVMVGLDIEPAALDGFWQVLRGSSNMLGCSITYPHKQAAFDAVDGMTDRAKRLGALNTIRREPDGRLTGDATDGLAMVSTIAGTGIEIRSKTAWITGAGGGAGKAIIDAFSEQGIGRLILEEIDPARCEAALRLVRDHWPKVEISDTLDDAQVLVNATTLGKSEKDPLPFPEAAIAKAELCCDVVTASGDTAFVQAAKAAGKTVVDGSGMGAGQLDVQLGFLGLDIGAD